jgi:hypothetical protein
MSGLFNCEAVPGGVFEACTATGFTQTLSFDKATRDQNSFGEITLSYTSHIAVTGDLQPTGGGYPRYLQGVLTEVNYEFTVQGNPDIDTGMRTCSISAVPVEVINVNRFGITQADILLRYVR